MANFMVKLTFGVVFFMMFCATAIGAERVQPFVLASETDGSINEVVSATKQKLEEAGFDLIGQYSPYANAEVIAITIDGLKAASLKSERGGYGAVMRVSVSQVDGKTQVAYTNPGYVANAYRMNDDLAEIASQLKSALGFVKEFGSGDKKLSAKDMRKYHYTIMMEYFDDPSELNKFDSHEEAVKVIENNLSAGAGAASKVYQVSLGKDVSGNAMTLFGVALKGKDADDCSGDNYIMSRIDKSSPRHTAHLPYELLVYGNEVEALYARFRIAISWPHLPMMRSETGATFFSIMCAPGAIENALEKVAGK